MAELTRKQEKFVEAYIETGNGTQAALEAYDTDNPRVAAAIASENLTKPNIQASIEEQVPDLELYKILREGLYATKPIFTPKGELAAEEADFTARHKYLDTAFKLKGSYAPEKRLTVNVDVESTPELEQATKLLNEHFRQQGTSVGGDGTPTGPMGSKT